MEEFETPHRLLDLPEFAVAQGQLDPGVRKDLRVDVHGLGEIQPPTHPDHALEVLRSAIVAGGGQVKHPAEEPVEGQGSQQAATAVLEPSVE